MDELFDNLTETSSNDSSRPTGEGVVIDLGTGDGLFVYQCAQENPRKFYIGIDANARPLEKISEKIHRKPAKGGLPNVIFLQAAVEDLPSELDGVADEVHVHFPWGSLLRVFATGDEAGLVNVRRISAADALLEIVIGLDPERDRSEIERLGLDQMSASHVERELVPRYRAAGFDIIETRVLDQSQLRTLRTSWAKRLQGNEARAVIYIVAKAVVA